MPELLLGPLLRYVGQNEATIWVETDVPCEVDVLGHKAHTFDVEGHHYALVIVRELEPGTTTEYQVTLDGERRWPEPDSDYPPSLIRTLEPDADIRLVFGSCRVSLPHEPPYDLTKDEDDRGREMDALYAWALRMRRQDPEEWPELLLLLGDQVYADEVSLGTLEFIRSRRDTSEPPGETVADFEEYTRLYWDSWRDPAIRWLLSTIPTAMIFDDHDVHDDWNTSKAWVEEMRAHTWWNKRIVGAFMTYWLYQHIGNLSPRELDEDHLFQTVVSERSGSSLLREFAFQADRETEGARWSYCRDLGRSKLVVMDSRAGRVLTDERRCMIDDDEWSWIEQQATGGFDHLFLASTLPFLLAPGMHHLEAWNEAVCAGAWGERAAVLGEKLRQGLDLEHWAAFGESFERFVGLLRAVGSGERGEPPATIVGLSGDVHHAYLADVAFRRPSSVKSAVYQAVCSPFRNPLDAKERRVIEAGISKPAEHLGRAVTRAAGVEEPDIRWRFCEGPWFDNQVGIIDVRGRQATFRLEKTVRGEEEPKLEEVISHSLT